MRKRIRIGIAMLLTVITVPVFAKTIYPGGVKITRFETTKMIYKPKQPVMFHVEFAAIDNHQNTTSKNLEVQIWIENELNPAIMVVSKKIRLSPDQVIQAPIYNQPFITTPSMIEAKQHTYKIKWVGADKNIYGHRALVKIIDEQGRLLATQETFFDVSEKWWQVMRLATQFSSKIARPKVTNTKIIESVKYLRSIYINTVEMYKLGPEPYKLSPLQNEWPCQGNIKRTTSKNRVLFWGKHLRQNGMKFVLYNETSAIIGPPEWHTYHKKNMTTPFAHYYKEKGMFTPNSLKISDCFAKNLVASIRMFQWDGILMDSAFACHENTSKGLTKEGKQLTDLTAGEVGYIYMEQARKEARGIDQDFAFISQNANSLIRLLKKGKVIETNQIYPHVKERVKKLKADHYSQFVDMWTMENDAHNTPRDGRYPRTYERMSLSLNSIIEATGKPLMIWAKLASPFYKEYSLAFIRPYMATIFASRAKLHDHFIQYGGAWSQGKESPASRQFIKYNRFMARYSWYLWDPALKWLYDPNKMFQLEASRPIFWNRLVYQRQLDNGGTETVINIINLPKNGQIVDQGEIPPVAQNITLKIFNKKKIHKVTFTDADNHNLTSLILEKDRTEGKFTIYRIPPITCWGIIIVEHQK